MQIPVKISLPLCFYCTSLTDQDDLTVLDSQHVKKIFKAPLTQKTKSSFKTLAAFSSTYESNKKRNN